MRWYFLAAFAAMCLGCGKNDHQTAPVSGTITFDGKPLANAKVRFMPITKPGSTMGASSLGETAADGSYSLTTTDGKDGAIWGDHTVRITTGETEPPVEGKETRVIKPELLPEKYHEDTQLKFAVPIEGTAEANFDL